MRKPLLFMLLLLSLPVTAQRTRSKVQAEVMPSFRGNFGAWADSCIVFPQQALDEKVTGTVTAIFKIDERGKVYGIFPVSYSHQAFYDELQRVLLSSPSWTPGTRDGQRAKWRLECSYDFSKKLDPETLASMRVQDNVYGLRTYTPSEGSSNPEDSIYLYPKVPPKFKGWTAKISFPEWLERRVVIPRDIAPKDKKQLTATVIIEKDGSLSNVEILGPSNHPSIAKEVSDVVLSSARYWTPAMDKGEPVRHRFVFPVNYKVR